MKNKNFINLNFLIFLGLSLANCSNDIELFHERSPIPFVSCMINPADTFCYVTVTKSILDLTHEDRGKLQEVYDCLACEGKKNYEYNFSFAKENTT